MSCRDLERLIALHVEGDLREPERQRVEEHLRTCSDCWDLAEDLKESQSLFKSMRQDVPDQPMLSALRARVLEDVAGLDSATWFERFFLAGLRQKATLAGVALLVVGMAAWWLVPDQQVPVDTPSVPVVAHVPLVPTPEPGPRVSPVSKPKPRVRRRQAPVKQEPHEQVTIKLLTDDPNIIIYWLGDEKGD